MTLQFVADAEVYEEFFTRVQLLVEDTEENRTHLLLDMVEEGYPITVMKTNRTPDEVVRDYAKHGNVLRIKKEETSEAERKLPPQ